MSTIKRPQIFAYQSGLASVEFAMILPLMLLLMFSTAELGRALYSYNTLTKVVRDGARYAAESALDGVQKAALSDELTTKVKDLVVMGTLAAEATPLLSGFNSDDVTVEILQGSGYDEPHVRVTANYRFEPFIGSIPGLDSQSKLITGFDMHSSVTMRAL